ncbi:HupE/UreJ family protein [Hymenobacter sp. RP-2-7]|uniref:HupE/UreJ family protein n=1 Tax=Hymenobacter polaris TaxID=2682546 RepID=A0A7Y0AF42_9BACT|nr:HupE/UreJ family protein [Hymenobacter polaris]NML66172.1 HupE/UreJ family protein [Hymenobacter polaris]
MRKLRLVLTRLLGLLLIALLLLASRPASAHPMPTSRVLLDLQAQGVAAEVQLPLSELQLALGDKLDVLTTPAYLVERAGPALRAYLLAHVRATTPTGRPWTVAVRALAVGSAEQTATGPYQELTARLWLQPPPSASAREFTLAYDAIIHQVVTHAALVAIRQDWDTGVLAEHPVEVGAIRLNARDNSINTLTIAPAAGSRWQGFRTLVALGMQHIGEGTDHLLFLLALLLPAPLLARSGRWVGFGGVRYSLGRLLRIVTAFTLGHSFTLLLGALGWVRLPGQPVEVLIAVSILVSAVHAWRPVFAGREGWVAGGFGLVHGLAFASTLAGLHLDASRLALSILGFNVGIELMQLLVVALTVPWLLLLSQTPAYPAVRRGGAVLAGAAALAWLAERLTSQPNAVATLLSQAVPYAPWLLALLATAALLVHWRARPRPA